MSLPEPLQSLSWVAWILAIIFLFERFISFLKNVEWIMSKFRPKPKWSDDELKKEVTSLIENVESFFYERKLNDPIFSRKRFDNESERKKEWENYVENSTKYSNETMSLYKIKFLERMAKIREEFNRRGILDEELDMFYQNPVNPLGVGEILRKFAEMSARV